MIKLQLGAAGPEVTFLQRWLAALNPNPEQFSRADPVVSIPAPQTPRSTPAPEPLLSANGTYDQHTSVAVSLFQNKIPVVTDRGSVDHRTWWALAQVARNNYFVIKDPPSQPAWLARLCSPVIPPPRGLSYAKFSEAYTELFRSPGKSADGLQKLLTYINADSNVTDIRFAAYMLATVHKECGPSNGMQPVTEGGCDDNNTPVCSTLPDGNTRNYGARWECPPLKELMPFVTSPRENSPLLTKFDLLTKREFPPPPYKPGLGPSEGWRPKAPKCPAGKTFHTYYGRGYVQLSLKRNYTAMSAVTGIDLVHYPERALEHDLAYKIMSHGMRNGFFGAKLSAYISGAKCDYYGARNTVNSRYDRAGEIEDWAKRYEIALYFCLS